MAHNTNPITLTRWILASQKDSGEAVKGDLTLILQSVQLAIKVISDSIRRAGITNLYGLAGESNASGDDQKKLDVLSNEIFVNALRFSERICVMVSEEEEDPILLESENGKYVIAFDPLDGSSNIDANVSVGTIFGVYRQLKTGKGTVEDALQPGTSLVCAGYSMYGSATTMVLAINDGPVTGFTLDPNIGEFIVTHPDIKIPKRGAIYSVNEGNCATWHDATKNFVNAKKFPTEGKPYSLRYIGSMVADVHRTLLYGGIFMYPADKKNARGKLRLLYECNPMAYIMEKAGGKASTGTERILELQPSQIHERAPIYMGSADDVTDVEDFYKKFPVA